MMEWQKKMLEGMRLMQEACAEVGSWNDCRKCPFGRYCDTLMENDDIDSFMGLQDKEWIGDEKVD